MKFAVSYSTLATGPLEYTRFGSASRTPDPVEALAAAGVTRLAVSGSQHDLSALADRFGFA